MAEGTTQKPTTVTGGRTKTRKRRCQRLVKLAREKFEAGEWTRAQYKHIELRTRWLRDHPNAAEVPPEVGERLFREALAAADEEGEAS